MRPKTSMGTLRLSAFRRVRSQKLVHLGAMALLLMPIMGLTVEPNAEAASRDVSFPRAGASGKARR
jgi:hypothetical protein